MQFLFYCRNFFVTIINHKAAKLPLRIPWTQHRQRLSNCICHFIFPAGNYMFKVNNKRTRTRCQISSKLKIKTPKLRQWRRSGVLAVNFKHISTPCSTVFIANFKQVNASWVVLQTTPQLDNQHFFDCNKEQWHNILCGFESCI